MTASRELELVELVTPAGARAGSATVGAAHTAPGRLHRAFSVLLMDGLGRILLQQRAAAKTRFPLRWANSCCGHPAPGEPVAEAATRRLGEELGLDGVRLEEVGVYTYRATDPSTERVEHEYDHVLLGHVSGDLACRPDPGEIADTRWTPSAELLDELRHGAGGGYAPWLRGVLEIGVPAYGRRSRPPEDLGR